MVLYSTVLYYCRKRGPDFCTVLSCTILLQGGGPDSPGNDVNSILAGAHLQVGGRLEEVPGVPRVPGLTRVHGVPGVSRVLGLTRVP